MSATNPTLSTVATLPRTRLALIAFFAAYFLIWILLPLLLHSHIPGDNLEQLAWSENPAWGYAKHPPFPTWILCLFALVAPKGVPLTYVLGGLDVAIMLLVAWRLMKESLGSTKALLGVLLITCVNYHTNRMHFYNHNTALLAANALSIYCVWRCSRSLQWKWWIALGLAWAMGMLSKYQMVVPIACNLIFLYVVRPMPLKRLIGYVSIASITCLVAISPHIFWLYSHHFPTFQYASHSLAADLSMAQRFSRMASFSVSQMAKVVPMLLLLGILSRFKPAMSADGETEKATVQLRRLLAVHAWMPLVLMLLLSLLAGVDPQMHWGTAFLWMIPLWIVSTRFGERLASLSQSQIMIAACGVQVLMIAGYVLHL